jgi:hypothetical protein
MGTELPPGWRELAGGFASGDVLLVLTGDGLHRVKARDFGHGYAIEKTPLDVVKALLATHGLHIVSAADKAVLDWAARLSVAELGLLRGDERDQSEASIGFAQSELARREAKP